MYTFEVLNRKKGLLTLLINDCCKFSVLVLNLLDDFFLDAFLLLNSRFHGLTILERCVRLVKQLFKQANLDCTRLLKGHSASVGTIMCFEVTIVAEGLIARWAIGS